MKYYKKFFKETEETILVKGQKMYDMFFNLKILPPGRGLWIMGTDFVDKHGGMALNNCAFVSTKNKDAFSHIFQLLMLGVGVGFDSKGERDSNL